MLRNMNKLYDKSIRKNVQRVHIDLCRLPYSKIPTLLIFSYLLALNLQILFPTFPLYSYILENHFSQEFRQDSYRSIHV
jgi:hypothetical protein